MHSSMDFANVYIHNNELAIYTGTQEVVMKHFCGITLNQKVKARQVYQHYFIIHFHLLLANQAITSNLSTNFFLLLLHVSSIDDTIPQFILVSEFLV